MDIFTKTEARLDLHEIAAKIQKNTIFIHPTDTIYGLGCNALDKEAVAKLREIKQRPDQPLSVWVPSVSWIKKNCDTSKAKAWLDKLPGPYTLILPVKNKVLTENVAPGLSAIGVRMPDHWFQEVVTAAGVPIITTSANKAGNPFMTDKDNLDPEIIVDFMVYEGEKKARPSKVVNLVKNEIKER